MRNHIENEYARFWIDKDILYFTYKKGIIIDQSVAIKVVEDRLLLQQGKPFLILCDIRGVKSANKSARNYLAIEGSVLTKAIALIANTPLTDTLSGFYIKTNNPPIITQVFTKEEDAVAFLNNYNATLS
ncbi:MAG: hypothetical protein ABJK28_00655 [Algibacter sp.]